MLLRIFHCPNCAFMGNARIFEMNLAHVCICPVCGAEFVRESSEEYNEKGKMNILKVTPTDAGRLTLEDVISLAMSAGLDVTSTMHLGIDPHDGAWIMSQEIE